VKIELPESMDVPIAYEAFRELGCNALYRWETIRGKSKFSFGMLLNDKRPCSVELILPNALARRGSSRKCRTTKKAR
jgi:hypothetical protein